MLYLIVMDQATVLIVEDDASIQALYKDAFEFSGLTVIIANNGQEGVALALANHPDLILADLMMPEMNGHQMMEKIRLDSWGRKAKVIFLTNFSDPETVFHSIKLKPEEFIVKAHTEVKEVVNKVRTAIHA